VIYAVHELDETRSAQVDGATKPRLRAEQSILNVNGPIADANYDP